MGLQSIKHLKFYIMKTTVFRVLKIDTASITDQLTPDSNNRTVVGRFYVLLTPASCPPESLRIGFNSSTTHNLLRTLIRIGKTVAFTKSSRVSYRCVAPGALNNNDTGRWGSLLGQHPERMTEKSQSVDSPTQTSPSLSGDSPTSFSTALITVLSSSSGVVS